MNNLLKEIKANWFLVFKEDELKDFIQKSIQYAKQEERERIRKEVTKIDWDITSFDIDIIIFNHNASII